MYIKDIYQVHLCIQLRGGNIEGVKKLKNMV